MAIVELNRDEKTELLGQIRRAKSSHIRWRAFAQGLVAGVSVSKERLPIVHTDCQFGKWYYGEGRALLGHLAVFHDVEAPHQMLHAIYAQIYALTQNGSERQAREKLEELIGVSRVLLDQIGRLEAEVEYTYKPKMACGI